MDEEARKQLLLTRIAHERAQLTYDLEVFRTVATPRHVASNAVKSVLPSGLERFFFGSDSGHGQRGSSPLSHQLLRAVLIARRYPIVLSIVGGLLARRVIRRVLIAATFGVAVVGGLWFANQQRR